MAGIYLHIPFCKQACSYCDFHFSTSLSKKEELVKSLVKELKLRKKEIDQPIETIYLGGGTPSLFHKDELNLLLKTISKHYIVIDNAEITIEANPDDLKGITFKDYKAIGINRLSIGVQSFFDDDLRFMKRAHNATEAKEVLKSAVKHFDNISVDLIYGTPTITDKNWIKNIQTLLDYNIEHVSCYALTVEPKTLLANLIEKNKIKPLDEEKAQRQFYLLKETLEKNNFDHYEISNFAKNGKYSKHNTSYWQGKPYIGIGPSAHSFIKNKRCWNVNNNTKYIKVISNNKLPQQSETLSKIDLFNETVMIGLRTSTGIDLSAIATQFGSAFLNLLNENALHHLKNKSLEITNGYLKTTKKGLFFVDGIASDLFVIDEK